jgi:putative ABC transport system ATP-binding protein
MSDAKSFLLNVRNVSKRYGEHQVQALQSVSLTVESGEFVAIMGPSGCGKSTLLNVIAGIDRVDQGVIQLAGQELTNRSEDELTILRREKIGFVFQFFNLLSTLTVAENVALPLELTGKSGSKEIYAKVDQLLKEVNLLERKQFFPSQLSGGEMQRIAVARAIIHYPEVVLADEPTGNLDTENGIIILKLLQALCRENHHTILMATHSDEAASYASRVVRMKDGQVVEEVRQ